MIELFGVRQIHIHSYMHTYFGMNVRFYGKIAMSWIMDKVRYHMGAYDVLNTIPVVEHAKQAEILSKSA